MRERVEGMGGRITIQSANGTGTVILIALPLRSSLNVRFMSAASKTRLRNASADKIRVLIADDHVTVREGLVAIIGRQPDMMVVGEAAHGREAVDLWRKHHPDVALLDLRMPMLDGVGAMDEIRRQDASARVIVLTTFDTDADISRAIKAGAKGYMLKDAQREELLDCIRRVHAGETSIPPALVAKLAAAGSATKR